MGKDVIILYDRAIIDNRAYLSQEDYDSLLSNHVEDEMKLIDKYDLVIDLISTATAKKECYVTNHTRSETIEQASRRDKLTSLSWLLHRNLKVIKPTDTMEQKANIVLDYIRQLLNHRQINDNQLIELEREKLDYDRYDEDNSKLVNITNIYLNNFDGNKTKMVLVKRQNKKNISYLYEERDENVIESSKPIDKEEYIEIMCTHKIYKIENINVLSFMDNGNYFKLITNDDKTYLETEKKNMLYIPEYIPVSNGAKTLIKQKNMIL